MGIPIFDLLFSLEQFITIILGIISIISHVIMFICFIIKKYGDLNF